jgi:hypothetical protein
MYPNIDVQTTLTLARLHQNDIRVAFPRRRHVPTWLRHRSDEPAVARLRTFTPPAQAPTQHRPAA